MRAVLLVDAVLVRHHLVQVIVGPLERRLPDDLGRHIPEEIRTEIEDLLDTIERSEVSAEGELEDE